MKGCNEVSLVPSLLQAKQAQFPQRFFIGEVHMPLFIAGKSDQMTFKGPLQLK